MADERSQSVESVEASTLLRALFSRWTEEGRGLKALQH
jgi:hypothetical protein